MVRRKEAYYGDRGGGSRGRKGGGKVGDGRGKVGDMHDDAWGGRGSCL